MSGVPCRRKCTSYAECGLHWGTRSATEACFLDSHDDSSECAANLFLVKGKQLITPWLASGCLPGITRSLVLEILGKVPGMECQDRPVRPAEVESADALFLTSSLAGNSTRFLHGWTDVSCQSPGHYQPLRATVLTQPDP